MKRLLLLPCLVLSSLSFAPPLSAHEGHDHAADSFVDTDTSATTLTLSDETIANLGVETAKAVLQPLPETITLPALVTLPPERRAVITPRFDGTVQAVYVKLGDTVEKGQKLVGVQPVLSNTQIIPYIAPIAGRIVRQDAVPGQPVTFETVLMEIADTRDVLVQGTLYESPDLLKIKAGQKAQAVLAAAPDHVWEGAVQQVAAGSEQDSRAFHVYASFANPDDLLKPNLRATLVIQLNTDDTPTTIVPASAVLEKNGAAFVFVREGNGFERREVATGRRNGANVEILSGVLPDDDVVTRGNYQMQYIKAAGGR